MFEKQVLDFIKKKSNKDKMIVVYGPTASGKTDLAIKIAKELNTEIISTDSRQIFRKMNIGTAKILEEEKKGIKHHMIDIIFPNEEYSVGKFKKQADKVIKKLIGTGKIPILAGGTGLYIDSLIYDFNIPKIKADWKLRKQLEEEVEKFGKEYLYDKLKKIDPDNYHKVHMNNTQYVIRAIEVKTISGESKYKQNVDKNLKYDVLFLTPYDDNREKLYNRIDLRVDKMFEMGLVEEVKFLLGKYKKTDFGLQTIGYIEIIDFLEGKTTLEEAKENIKKNSRNYAKRQLTWFRKYTK